MFNDCSSKSIVYMKEDDVEMRTVTVTYSGYIKHAAGEKAVALYQRRLT